jgi:hypothetical protein
MSLNKTISINPTLFSIGGSKTKTKKNKEKKNLNSVKPIINPNILKNKLLKRIKEHKQRETADLDKKHNKNTQNIENTQNTDDKNDETNLKNEFNDSINYLQTLSKQKKINDEKTNYEKQKQKKISELEKKTVKNYNSMNNNVSPLVNIELPEELKIVDESHNQNNQSNPIVLNKYKIDTVPYGVLKGGIKPTYRNWSISQRNNVNLITNSEVTSKNKEKVERELRLQNLRTKLKNKEIENNKIKFTESLERKVEPIQQKTQSLESKIEPLEIKIEKSEPLGIQNMNTIVLNNNNNNIGDQNIIPFSNLNKEEIIATKKITTKTIKNKYTLGKSKIKKSVGILIKDRGTRKQIINAQKDLKKKALTDVKSYLRDHNLIKIGSNAPNDVIRKIYESAMLAGDITNSNSEILLHNFSKEDKEL